MEVAWREHVLIRGQLCGVCSLILLYLASTEQIQVTKLPRQVPLPTEPPQKPVNHVLIASVSGSKELKTHSSEIL